MRKFILLAGSVVLLASCAAPSPMVDTKGVDLNQYAVDLRECQAYAEQTYGAGTGAAAGAGMGYILGQVLARATGNRGLANQTGRGAAILGGASGAGQGAMNQRQVVQRCLSGRGYNVLN